MALAMALAMAMALAYYKERAHVKGPEGAVLVPKVRVLKADPEPIPETDLKNAG